VDIQGYFGYTGLFCGYIGLFFLINTPLSSFTNSGHEDVWFFGGYIGPVRGFVGLFC